MRPLSHVIPTPTLNKEEETLLQLKTQLLSKSRHPTTTAILASATIPDLRAIEKILAEVNMNSALMEWATILLNNARCNPADHREALHFWKNAIIFIHERLKTRGWQNCGEAWMLLHEKTVLPTVIQDYIDIASDAAEFLAMKHLECFFQSMLCFASHYAKHAVCLDLTVAEYLGQIDEILQLTPFVENRNHVYKRKGWMLFVAHEKQKLYIKTLYLKFQYHKQFLAKRRRDL